MDDRRWRDDLTVLERKVYRWVAYSAVGIVAYCFLLLPKYASDGPPVLIGIGFVALLIAIVFGWGYNKSVRVLDLRRFGKCSSEGNSDRDR
jgi:hypothetical protein